MRRSPFRHDSHGGGAIKAIVEDAVASGSPEAVTRIGRVAEMRLESMARREITAGNPGPGSNAHVLVADMLRRWRADHAAESAEARRDKVRGRHTHRTFDTRNAVMAAARLFGIENLVTQAATRASLTKKTAQ